MIDTQTHIDGEDFAEDRAQTVLRAQDAGVEKIFVPAIDLKSIGSVVDTCRQFPGYAYPMIGLHPEEVKEDWKDAVGQMRRILDEQRQKAPSADNPPFIAIGEVGLDFYWSREFEKEQLEAFEEQVRWSIEADLPLMIHCRKAQNEMVAVLRRYQHRLHGGVFHCFTGNGKEAAELLSFDGFALGIGGVLTFKSSHLRDDLPAHVPLSRIVLETDSPYMAPVPNRGKRNEPSFLPLVCRQLAESYGVSEQTVAKTTTATATEIFKRAFQTEEQKH